MIKEKRYKVSVKTPNRFLNIKSKVVRTPTDFIITEGEIKKVETKLKSDGITNYSIDLISDIPKAVDSKKVSTDEIIKFPKPEINIEIKNENEQKSTLSKILNS